MAAVMPLMIAWIGAALVNAAQPRVADSLNAAYAVGSALGVLTAGFAGCLFIDGAVGTATLKPLFERGNISLMFLIAALIAGLIAASVSLTVTLVRRAIDRPKV